jgi:lysophospholipase L1-like esterase
MRHLLAIMALASASPALADGTAKWGGAWGYATSPATKAVKGELPAGSYRYRLRLSQSGDGLRLSFTNPEGGVPLQVARVSVAPAAGASGFAVEAGRERPVSFSGAVATTIAAGAVVDSDPVAFVAASGGDVIVTVTTAAPSTTVGGNAGFPLGFSPDAPTPEGTGFTAQKLRPFVTLVAVRNPPATCTIVAFGDSITEGARGTRADWRGWPGALADHLIAAEPRRHCGVVNAGISGNRLLRDGRGTAGINRFERDVASVPGATDLIVLEGINDIWHSAQPGEAPVSADDLIAGYRTLIAKAHARGMRVYGATLTPGAGSKYLTPPLEALREQVNRWIRTARAFDVVIDLEQVVRDDATPPQLRPAYDSGDHLHPGDAGYAAMGQAIPLALFPPRS